MDEQLLAGVGVMVSLVALVGVPSGLRRRRQRRDEAALSQVLARGSTVPPSLHPVIDTELCIGSLACLKACPEGDILGIIDGAARLVHAENCLGHGHCAAACPVGAITLVQGSAKRGVDLPEVDGRFESARQGVHLVGELAGMGRIANAMEQAEQCAGFLAEDLARRPRDGAGSDVLVVGAGPAGVSCALWLKSRGLSVRLVDKEEVGAGALANPRKGVMLAGPLSLPGVSSLRGALVSRTELGTWLRQALDKADLQVEPGVVVTGLSGEDGAFTVETSLGPLRARKVVLATGRRGPLRRLAVPGANLPKVSLSLGDPASHRGALVLVVGGGDAAVEAACNLADVAQQVTLVARGGALTRCTSTNQQRLMALAQQGRVDVRLATEVTAIEAQHVQLRSRGVDEALPNDTVITCLGGELSLGFLSSLGISLSRPPGAALAPLVLKQSAPVRSSLVWWLLVAAAVVLAGLAGLLVVGVDYYVLSGAARLASPLHELFRPASSLGLDIGIAATAIMLTNFGYALRKRWRALAGVGTLAAWLNVHVFVGLFSPLVILFHAAFQANNGMARFTYLALGIVVATGIVGRYVYALVPGGQAVELADLLAQRERLVARLQAQEVSGSVAALVAHASAPVSGAPFLVQLAAAGPRLAWLRLRVLVQLRGASSQSRGDLLRLRQLSVQVGLFGGAKRLMRAWRGLHASLAVLLVVALAAHVALVAYLGYLPH